MKQKPSLRLTPESSRPASTLNDLLSKAQLHAHAERAVLSAIPAMLKSRIRFVSFHDGELTLSAENATIASQLRYRQHEVLEALRQQDPFRFAWKLTVKVRPARHQRSRSRTMQPLSNENARLLKEEAGHTKDKKLREVLEKLASHARD
ncbi:DciA family protein [Marinobacter sp. SS21]|uniref:DciA family protein n=1 Tax=Marinobacter sp. SS21 TaxID=2979460 RepID=UPI00233093D7|nr:DciA family protein [Marinobacter sp. SS21]MDC0664072.1 DciA family protein [Marinobacter sp. SS21]